MIHNYFNLNAKRITILFLLFFCIGISQNLKALNSSFEIKSALENSTENNLSKKTNSKNSFQYENTSSKKATFNVKSAKESTKIKAKQKKISAQKKLSILKLVLKSKHSKQKNKNEKYNTKKKTQWNGGHTAGLLSWASVLVAVMAFFTSHFLLGILASCSAILFLLLIFVENGSKGTVDDVLWLFSQIINVIVIIATIFD